MLRLDGASWTDMQNRLNDLAAESNPWRFSARELLALAAHKAGKSTEARQEFQKLLGDRNTPPSIAERARVMMAMLTESELARITTPAAEVDKAQPTAPAPPGEDKVKAKPADKKAK